MAMDPDRLARRLWRWGLVLAAGILSTQLLVLACLSMELWSIRQWLQVWGSPQWQANTGRAVVILRSSLEETRRVLQIVQNEQQVQERRNKLLLDELDLLKRMLKDRSR